jgi:hypothetical protein
MKRLAIALMLLISSASAYTQELYVATEPASNMPQNALGIRLTQEAVFRNGYMAKIIPEAMLGLTKNLMIHQSLFINNVQQNSFKTTGGAFYAKYRFLSIDSMHSHFRGAVYGGYAAVNGVISAREISLDGDNTGWQGGIVFTQLLHKLALSGSVSYTKALNNKKGNLLPADFGSESLGYTLSSGLLVYPKSYRSYKQTNVNVYLEFLGKSNLGKKEHVLDAAPALQFIINSNFRIDVSQRVQLWSSMTRNQKNLFLLRLEYNLFNLW